MKRGIPLKKNTFIYMLPLKLIDDIVFEVFDCSGHIASYEPNNLKLNDPDNPYSRWTADTAGGNAYVILKMTPSVITAVSFGKFRKPHICTAKNIRIFSSIDGEKYVELYSGALTNNPTMESVKPALIRDGALIISQYLKIIPEKSFGAGTTCSLWYIRVAGVSNQSFIDSIGHINKEIMYEKTIRYVLKFIAHNNVSIPLGMTHGSNIYRQGSSIVNLHDNKKLYLEVPEINELYCLLNAGDREGFEVKLVECSKKGMLKELNIDTKPIFSKVHVKNIRPSVRSGHSLVAVNGILYLYGGWTGQKDVGDVWSYSKKKWEPIGSIRQKSCHRMHVCHSENGWFTFRSSGMFSLSTGSSPDMELDPIHRRYSEFNYSGDYPPNLYDHAIVSSPDNKIYVFGGKTVTSSKSSYSGLYQILGSAWNKIAYNTDELPLRSNHNLFITKYSKISLLSKFNHFNSLKRYFTESNDDCLVVVGGKNGRIHYNSITIFSIHYLRKIDEVKIACSPESVIISSFNGSEVYIISMESGGSKLFIYDLIKGWHLEGVVLERLVPRKAAQFTFCDVTRCFYLFGGKHISDSENKRYNDLWLLRCGRYPPRDYLMQGMLVSRIIIFRSLAHDPEKAIIYLRSKIFPMVRAFGNEFMQYYDSLYLEVYGCSILDATKLRILIRASFKEELVEPMDSLENIIPLKG